MKIKPLVSIITSCYNHESYLDDYFNGLLSQTYKNLETIIFDDGSSDKSWEKIMSYEPKLEKAFTRVLLEKQNNMGYNRVLAKAMKKVAGKYVCFIASDDYYLPHKVQDGVDYLESHPEMGAVHGDADFIYKDHLQHSHWKTCKRIIPEGNLYEFLLKKYTFLKQTACFRTQLVQKYVNFQEYADKNYYMEDYPMMLDLSRFIKIGYIDKPLVRYRVRSESLSHSNDSRKAINFLRAIHRVRCDYIKKYGASKRTKYLASKDYHEDLYHAGYEKYSKKEFCEGYMWLVKNEPKEYKKLWHLTRKVSIHNKLLWNIVMWMQKNELFYKFKTFFKLLADKTIFVSAHNRIGS